MLFSHFKPLYIFIWNNYNKPACPVNPVPVSHQIQDYYDVQFYNYDTVMKLSSYNKLLKLRNMDTIELKDNEYFLVTTSQSLYKIEGNDDIKNIQFSGKELHVSGGLVLYKYHT